MTSAAEPYTAVIFSSERSDLDPDEYDAMAVRMAELAARQPGYRGLETARDPNGFGITVSYWDSEEHARAWKQQTEHLEAQRLGRERWYRSYRLRVATVEREYTYDQPHVSSDGDTND